MEAELVDSALTMKECVFCSNMMTELGFKQHFGQVSTRDTSPRSLIWNGSISFLLIFSKTRTLLTMTRRSSTCRVMIITVLLWM